MPVVEKYKDGAYNGSRKDIVYAELKCTEITIY